MFVGVARVWFGVVTVAGRTGDRKVLGSTPNRGSVR